MIEIGDIITFEYPDLNQIGAKTQNWKQWSIEVTWIRDLLHEPLSCETISRDPLTGRSRYLITGTCQHTGVERSFYSDAMSGGTIETWLTFAMYDPIDDNPDPLITDGAFPPTIEARRHMADTIEIFNADARGILSIAVQPIVDEEQF